MSSVNFDERETMFEYQNFLDKVRASAREHGSNRLASWQYLEILLDHKAYLDSIYLDRQPVRAQHIFRKASLFYTKTISEISTYRDANSAIEFSMQNLINSLHTLFRKDAPKFCSDLDEFGLIAAHKISFRPMPYRNSFHQETQCQARVARSNNSAGSANARRDKLPLRGQQNRQPSELIAMLQNGQQLPHEYIVGMEPWMVCKIPTMKP